MALGHSKSLSEEVSSMSRDSNLQALTQLQDAHRKLLSSCPKACSGVPSQTTRMAP